VLTHKRLFDPVSLEPSSEMVGSLRWLQFLPHDICEAWGRVPSLLGDASRPLTDDFTELRLRLNEDVLGELLT